MFSHLNINETTEFATIYYLLTVLFENKKFTKTHQDINSAVNLTGSLYANKETESNKVTISPSITLFNRISKTSKVFKRADSSPTKFLNIQKELLNKGIISRVLYTKDDKKSGLFFPANPKTIWDQISINFSTEEKNTYNKYEQIITRFGEEIHSQKFGLNSPLLKNKYNVIHFTSQWMIYLLLTHATKDSDLLLLLSKMRTEKEKNSRINEKTDKFYGTLLKKGVKVQIILDGRDKEDINNAKDLEKKYSCLNIKYNYEELKGTSRRILLKNSFAADVIKILSQTNEYDLEESTHKEIQSDTFYVGILYSDHNTETFEHIFKSWWNQSVNLEEILKSKPRLVSIE